MIDPSQTQVDMHEGGKSNALPPLIQLENPNVVPMNEAMERAFEQLEIPRLGGASGRGWSSYNVLQQCPQKFYLRYLKKVEQTSRRALEIGSAFHAFLALYYVNMQLLLAGQEEGPHPSDLRDGLLDIGADPTYTAEAWRLFDVYADHYEGIGDYLEPIAIEVLASDKETGNTCRYDLIAKVTDAAKDKGIIPGTYIVEHKTSSRLDQATCESWALDGEIIGQLLLYRRAKLAKRYGKIQGVIVNIVVKTKVVKFHREIVVVPNAQVKQQGRDLEVWAAMERMYRAMGKWPRALSHCYGHKYGPCDYVDICKGGK